MRRTGIVALALLAVVTRTASAQTKTKERFSITIQKPGQNESVGVRHEVCGRVSEKGAKVWVVVQPRETADCWVQNPTVVGSDGTWRLIAQFGEETAAHSGKQYEIRALANPKVTIRPGKTTCWPEAEVFSDPVYVVRK